MSMTKGKVRWWEEGTNPPGRFNFHRVASDQAPGVRPAPSQILSLSLSLCLRLSHSILLRLSLAHPPITASRTHMLSRVFICQTLRDAITA